MAATAYDLELLPSSSEGHAALSGDGRKVQIKATQVGSVSLSSEPDYLLVIQIQPDGSFIEIYNGPGNIAWAAAGKLQKNGQWPISLYKLTRLMKSVQKSEQLRRSTS